MKKKILLGIILGAVVLLLVSVGVLAYFSDTETASGNTFAASTLNLQVGTADPCTESINIASLTPPASGNAATWLVRNTGAATGDLRVAVSAIVNNENTCSEVEAEAGDVTTGALQGEMGGNMRIALWLDTDKSDGWNTGDSYLQSDGSIVAYASGATLPAEAFDTVDAYGSRSWTAVVSGAGDGDIGNFRVEYDLPGTVDSKIQSDNCVFSLSFTLSH